MELEKRVVSLELAKKLKELGVKQESLFYFVNYQPDNQPDKFKLEFFSDQEMVAALEQMEIPHFSAFTTAELGEMLPSKITFTEIYDEATNTNKFLRIDKMEIVDSVEKEEIGTSPWNVRYDDDVGFRYVNLVDAMAQMLIYLLENNLITLPAI